MKKEKNIENRFLGSSNTLDFKNYQDFKQKTGLDGIDAVEFLLKELQKIKGR